MSYVGNKPALNYVNLAVQHFTTSATASYTLNQSVSDEVDIALFINNVRQQPGSSYAYTATGTALTLSSATAGTDTMYCIFLGKAVETVNPPAGSVNTSELVDLAVTTAKVQSDAITYDKIQDLGTANRVLGGSATGTVGEVQITDSMSNFVSTSSNAGLQIKGDNTTAGTLQLNCEQNSHGVKIKSPAHSSAANYTLTLPTTDGNTSEFLQTNGSGVLTWADPPGGAQVLVTTQNISTATTNIDFTIDGTYKYYIVRGANVQCVTDGVTLLFNLNVGGSWISSGGNYSYSNTLSGQSNTSSLVGNESNSANDIKMHGSTLGNATGENLFFEWLISAPFDTDNRKVCNYNVSFVNDGNNLTRSAGGAYYRIDEDQTVQGVRFKMSSGDIDKGYFRMWGIL